MYKKELKCKEHKSILKPKH